MLLAFRCYLSEARSLRLCAIEHNQLGSFALRTRTRQPMGLAVMVPIVRSVTFVVSHLWGAPDRLVVAIHEGSAP